MKSRVGKIFAVFAAITLAVVFTLVGLRTAYPRPYFEAVSAEEVEDSLIYAIIKAESGFREDAVSRAGAVGLMQMKPSTAEFICQREDIIFDADRLTDGVYNILLGSRYLVYLFERFPCEDTAIAAYNAGEGTVSVWLKEGEFSSDGVTLHKIPYAETAAYVKKVKKFRKIYEILY